ncbi:hypothetical protein Bra5_CH01828 [Rhizobium phaseoli Brasil 5]|nr:hypothetical protein Bra5_CH01828 [Rhizobium phaseoli Brasil 5]
MLFRFPARRRIIFSRNERGQSRHNRRPRSGSLDDLILSRPLTAGEIVLDALSTLLPFKNFHGLIDYFQT